MPSLSKVKVQWVKLTQDNPDLGFNNDGPNGDPLKWTWQLEGMIYDQTEADKIRDMGLGIRAANMKGVMFSDADGVNFQSIKIKRKCKFKSKDGNGFVDNSPVQVVGPDLRPWTQEEIGTIGNGSIVNLQWEDKPYNNAFGQGVSHKLQAVQVVELVEYTGGTEALSFSAIGSDDANAFTAVAPDAPVGEQKDLY